MLNKRVVLGPMSNAECASSVAWWHSQWKLSGWRYSANTQVRHR